MDSPWFWLTAAGLMVAGLSALGAKLLADFSLADFEEYCRAKKRDDLFGEIFEEHEQVGARVESLQFVGTAILIVSIGGWTYSLGAVGTELSLGQSLGLAITILICLLLATAWVPGALVQLWSAPILFRTWRFWRILVRITWPIHIGERIVESFVRRLAAEPPEVEDEEEAFEDEIRTIMSAGHREGLLETDAREMIEGVIELGDTDVADIMTPRSNVDAFEIGLTWKETLEFAVSVGRTRIPVYEGSLDNIIGVLFVKDLLIEAAKEEKSQRRDLRELLRKPWFVPKTNLVKDLLDSFRHTRTHLAIVLDEYQSVAGVVTIEDVLEEIVGEIVDETDKESEQEIHQIDDRTAEVHGATHLEEVNERLGLDLPISDDFDTIGGLVVDQLGRIPKTGESIVSNNVKIAVLEASRRRVHRLRLEVTQKDDESLVGT